MGRDAGEVLEYVSRVEEEKLEDYVEDVSKSLNRIQDFFEEGMVEMPNIETTASMSADEVLKAGGRGRRETNNYRADYGGEVFVNSDIVPADPAPYERLQEVLEKADSPQAIVETVKQEIENEEERLEMMRNQAREVENVNDKDSIDLDLLREPLVYIKDFSDELIDEGVVGGYEVLASRRVIGNRAAMIVENYFMPDKGYITEGDLLETEGKLQLDD